MAISMTRTWDDADQYKVNRQTAQNSTSSVIYLVFDAADEAEVMTYANANVPTVYSGIPLLNISIVGRKAERIWVINAEYGVSGSNRGGQGNTHDNTYSFSLGGGTMLIREPLAVSTDAEKVFKPEIFAGLNPDENGIPQGVEIVAPAFCFDVVVWKHPEQVTPAYLNAVGQHVGRVNSNEFYGFPPKSVLFMGADGNRGGDDTDDWWQIGFKFGYRGTQQQKVTSWDAANQMETTKDIVMNGWEYLDVKAKAGVVVNNVKKTVIEAYRVCELYQASTFPEEL